MPRHAELALVLVLGCLLVPEAQAASFQSEVNDALRDVGRIYVASRYAIVALSLLAILGMGIAAYFGNFPWKWFWTLSGGLFVIGVGGFALNEFLKPEFRIGTGNTIDFSGSIFGSPPVRGTPL